MTAEYRELTRFLRGLGTDDVEHSDRSFLAHLVGVYSDLKAWGCSEEICNVGLFHSIYGTQKFRKFCLPLERRGDVRELIGERAERLAFVNCQMDRSSFDCLVDLDLSEYEIRLRDLDEPMVLDRSDFDDLCRVHLCDWLEQVPHSQQWDYRRDVYGRLAERLGGVARKSFQSVYALERQT